VTRAEPVLTFDNTITFGNLIAVVSFLAAAFVAIIKRDQRMSSLQEAFLRFEGNRRDDMARIKEQFEVVNVTLAKQAETLAKISVYDYRLNAMDKRMDDFPVEIRAIIGQYLAQQHGAKKVP
jgi:hypothetical protein